MSWTSDDPRLTAYALGELNGADKAAVEAALLAQPELKVAVEEIRQSATLFKGAFQAEAKFGLSLEQRDKVLNLKRVRAQATRTWWLALGTVAAGMASVVLYTRMPGAPSMKSAHDEALPVTEVYLADDELAKSAPPPPAKKQSAPKMDEAKQEMEYSATGGAAAPAESALSDESAYSESVAEGFRSTEAKRSKGSGVAQNRASLAAKEKSVRQLKPQWTLSGGGPAAQKAAQALEGRFKECSGGPVEFLIDPVQSKVTIHNDRGQTVAAVCWLRILVSQTWPGTASYQLTIQNP